LGRAAGTPDSNNFNVKDKIMPAEKGSAFLLKVGDGTATPVYTTIAGMRTTQLSINGDAVVITNKGSGGWRDLLSGAGVRSVSVSAAGVFTGSTAETRIKNSALSGITDDYELSFESGERMRGKFLVTRLDYSGDFNGERSYTLALESSGAVVSL
jgi:TP901-1 family phage major tail protein